MTLTAFIKYSFPNIISKDFDSVSLQWGIYLKFYKCFTYVIKIETYFLDDFK